MSRKTFEIVLGLMVEVRSVRNDTYFCERLRRFWINNDFDISQLDKACQKLSVNIEDILSIRDGKMFAGEYKVIS